MSALFGYEDENETPKQSAIAVMDVHAKRANLPTYSELVLLMTSMHRAMSRSGDDSMAYYVEQMRSILQQTK